MDYPQRDYPEQHHNDRFQCIKFLFRNIPLSTRIQAILEMTRHYLKTQKWALTALRYEHHTHTKKRVLLTKTECNQRGALILATVFVRWIEEAIRTTLTKATLTVLMCRLCLYSGNMKLDNFSTPYNHSFTMETCRNKPLPFHVTKWYSRYCIGL